MKMMLLKDLAFIFTLGIISAMASYYLDYLLGHPGKDSPNEKAIFFGWTLFLAKRRLKHVKSAGGESRIKNMRDDIMFGFASSLNNDNPIIRHTAIRNTKLSLVTQAKEFFKWEHAVGMCIYCTNVWINILSGLILIWFVRLNEMPIYFLPLLLIIFSHFVLRKINN